MFRFFDVIGEKMGIATSRIRMWFIYISFLTLGSPVVIYMITAFWMNMKRYILAARRNPLRYL
jgi:phage shock protein PspC (stress-responsive transcriptional regulator)